MMKYYRDSENKVRAIESDGSQDFLIKSDWTELSMSEIDEVLNPTLTPEEQVAVAKLQGVEFDGVMCSATAQDMWGLKSVEDWIRGGASTNFKFDNGNTLLLSAENIDAFYAVWVPFRASFFE